LVGGEGGVVVAALGLEHTQVVVRRGERGVFREGIAAQRSGVDLETWDERKK
jgi:hypothetical protein